MPSRTDITRALDPLSAQDLQRLIGSRQPPDDLARLPVAGYRPVGLGDLGQAALMDRVDQKFILPVRDGASILARLAAHYDMLEVDGVRQSCYSTTYHDTAERDMYMAHHQGKSIRYKVRARRYVDTHAEFLEVKRRNNKGRTQKTRIPRQGQGQRLDRAERVFVGQSAPYDPAILRPVLCNAFRRITLVARDGSERITFDLSLVMWTKSQCVSLPGVTIVEVKQNTLNRQSTGYKAIRASGARPTSFSKYCIGTAMLCPEIKHARFRPMMRHIDQIVRSDTDVERYHGPGAGRRAEPFGGSPDRQIHILSTHP